MAFYILRSYPQITASYRNKSKVERNVIHGNMY